VTATESTSCLRASPPSPRPRGEGWGEGSAPPSCLPPSPLHTFIQTRYDLHRTSRLLDLPIPDLLTWLADPQTNRTLQQLRAAAELALTLRALETRRTALDALEEVINATEDLIEKRRAATALLRALNTRPRTESDQSRVREHASAPSAQCPMPTASPAQYPIPTASPRDSGLRTQDSLASLLTNLADALARDRADSPTADNALAALHAACTDDATLNDRPIPADIDDFVSDADDLHDLPPIARVDVAPPTLAGQAAATRLTCVHYDDTVTTISVALINENGWRIIAIVTEPPDTS
jgi:hypothetical protein